MPSLSPLAKQARREEHAKNEKADIIYRIITNKKRSPKPSPSKSPRTPSKSPKPSPSKQPSPSYPSNTSLPPVSLRDLPDDVLRSYFSNNPNAGELLQERVELEEKIPKKTYENAHRYNMLNWYELSKNPSIFTY